MHFIQNKGIVVQGWYPLQRTFIQARAHSQSLAQVILRWNLQRNVTLIPGSSNLNPTRENTEIFDFVLTPQEMLAIAKLNRNEKQDWY